MAAHLFPRRQPKERTDAIDCAGFGQCGDIRNLGAYYASLKPPQSQPAAAPDALAQTGAKLAVQHRCKSCHGDDYVGVGPAARLAGQREDVLLTALRDFKSGKRVGSGVASMADVTYELNDADMQALAHYMAMRP